MKNQPVLSIIIPAFNEEDIIIETIAEVGKILKQLILMNKISNLSFMLFVDDGSSDNTWEIIKKYSKDPQNLVKAIKLSRNFGHQPALIAGYEYSLKNSDINVCIDADLQHDINLIPSFINEFENGFDIVYGVKNKRKSDTFFKKHSAQFFYRLMRIMGVKIIYNHADFRLLTTKSLAALMQYEESNLFLRGIIPDLGFKSKCLFYNIKERNAGYSKYSLKRMLSLAIEGITSFSIMPLRCVTFIGFVVFFFSLLMSGYVLISYLKNQVIAGWTSTIIPIYFLGGIQLMCLGIIGEYIGKIYKETKKRPRYLIDELV